MNRVINAIIAINCLTALILIHVDHFCQSEMMRVEIDQGRLHPSNPRMFMWSGRDLVNLTANGTLIHVHDAPKQWSNMFGSGSHNNKLLYELKPVNRFCWKLNINQLHPGHHPHHTNKIWFQHDNMGGLDEHPQWRSVGVSFMERQIKNSGINYCIIQLLLLVCVSFTIIGQPRNSVLIRRV